MTSMACFVVSVALSLAAVDATSAAQQGAAKEPSHDSAFLILEVSVPGWLRQEILVKENSEFGVTVQHRREQWHIFGAVGTITDDHVRVSTTVASERGILSEQVLLLKIDGPAGRWGGGFGSLNPKVAVRRHVGRRLIPPDVVLLTKALDSEEAAARSAALHTLWLIGPEATEAIPAVVKTLQDTSPETRKQAAEALGAIGPSGEAIAALTDALADADARVRAGAADALSSAPPSEGSPAVPVLLKSLNDQDGAVRSAAVRALGALSNDSELLVRPLLEAMKDEDDSVRHAAAQALRFMEKADVIVPVLAEALKDEHYYVGEAAAESLKEFGPSAALAVPALAEALEQGYEVEVRVAAAEALAAIGPEAATAIPALSTILDREGEYFDLVDRVRMAAALGRLRPDSEFARRALIDALDDERFGTAQIAAEALAEMGKPCVAALIKALRERGEWGRLRAASTLGQIGPAATEGVGPLIHALEDESIASTAAEALGEIGPAARRAAPVLAKLADAEDKYLATQAMLALASIEPERKQESLRRLIALANNRDNEPSVRANIIFTLGQIGDDSQVVLDALIALLDDDSESTRLQAAGALGNLGPGAKKAIPRLTTALEEDSEAVRSAAAAALRAIRGETKDPDGRH